MSEIQISATHDSSIVFVEHGNCDGVACAVFSVPATSRSDARNKIIHAFPQYEECDIEVSSDRHNPGNGIFNVAVLELVHR